MRYKKYKEGFEELVGLANGQGLKIKFVPDRVTYDFVGMNPAAAEDIGFSCPRNTIEIDSNLNWKERYHTLKHELIELNIMGGTGCKYGPAHIYALEHEG
jgi:hypothetical protein